MGLKMKIFDLDSPLMNVLNKVADLMWLNILTLLCCIPIFTAGASFTALHYMCLKVLRNEESYISRGFFKSFKENFKQATIIWIIILVVAGILVGDYFIISKSGLEFNQVIQIIIMLVGILLLFTTIYVFPILAKFSNTTVRTIKNALVASLIQLPKTILMIVFYAIPIVLFVVSLRLFPFVFLFGLSVPAMLSAMVYNKFFKKLEVQIEEANAVDGETEEIAEEDDERIFKDELDESLINHNEQQ